MDALKGLTELITTVLSSVSDYFGGIVEFISSILNLQVTGLIKILLVILVIKLVRKIV